MKQMLAILSALLMGAVMLPVASAATIWEVADCDPDSTASNAVGDPDTSGNRVAARQSVLNLYRGTGGDIDAATRFSDEWRWQMICEAHNWKLQGSARGGNLNGDTWRAGGGRPPALTGQPKIDDQDALIMYYTYSLGTELLPIGDHQNADAILLRRALIASLSGGIVGGNQPALDAVIAAFRLRCTTDTEWAASAAGMARCDDLPNN